MHSAAILILLLFSALTGCTNLHPVDMDSKKLQEEIRDGNVIHEGETVRVVTRDGVSRLLVVTGVEENTLQGYAQGAKAGAVVIEIPLDDILLLEKEKVNAVDTTASTLGVTAIVLPLAILGILILGM
jgi:hypothetical protein